jgi:hypothetical protein
MLNHLISKFDLYRLYGVDTTREFYYERTIRNVRNNIKIIRDQYNLVSVTYADVHRYHAAEIAI